MGVRARLLLVVLTTVAVALITITVVFNVLLAAILARDVDQRLQTMADDTSGAISIVGGTITLPEPSGDVKQLGSQIWVFVSGKTFSSPDVNPEIDAAAKALEGQQSQFVDVPGQDVRMWAVALYDPTGVERIGTIVSAFDLAPYNRTRTMVLLGTGAFTAVLLLVVGFVGWWALNAAFRPVSRMTAEAETWSTTNLDQRFEMGDPHDELTQLAHTLDGMLDRLAASLRRERLFSAEVSHQLRTPVAKIKAEAELALRRERDPTYYQESLNSVLRSADQMARTVETLLAAAQEEGSLARGRADAWRVLEEVMTGVEMLAKQRGVEVKAQHPTRELRVGVGSDIATQVIQPVVENACRFATSRVQLGAHRKGKEIHFTVDDDGPGVADEEKEKIFEPGVRGSAVGGEQERSRGAGLGLSLARRLARAASGDVEARSGKPGGRFVVRLPGG
jgi:signal transduction histidine kinase